MFKANIIKYICYLQENFSIIFPYLMAIKVGDVAFLNYDQIKNFIENKFDQKNLYNLIRSQFLDILLKCLQMIVVNTEQPIIPIQINCDQFLSIMEIFQVKYIT